MSLSAKVDFAFLRSLLGVDESESVRAVMRAAGKAGSHLSHMVISVAARDGLKIGTGSADELRREREQAARYRGLAADIGAATPIRILKGQSIAGFYPPDVVRPSADLDLLLADEASLWRAAGVVGDQVDVELIDVSLLRFDGVTHVLAGLSWPSDDPLLDRDNRVELTTIALVGDYVRVPPSVVLPADATLAALVCLAEERFQHEFTVKDVVDVVMLFDSGPPDPDRLADTAVEYFRAPELLELLARTAEHISSPLLEECVERLRAPAEEERRRRTGGSPVESVPPTVQGRLAAGLPVYGFLLRRARRDWSVSSLHRGEGLDLLRTPVADFLLVAGELVTEDDYHAALRELDGLEVGSP